MEIQNITMTEFYVFLITSVSLFIYFGIFSFHLHSSTYLHFYYITSFQV